jgi:uncharacterized protein YwqG
MSVDYPRGLERFKSKLEKTVQPYIKIKPRLTRKASLWQSKFAGFPYLPKNFDYPTNQKGEYLYLLAQINFEEVSYLEGFPEKGILQFYLDKTPLYGLDFDRPTNQTGFRVLYFKNPDQNEDNLITNFDFLPTLWDANEDYIPFCIYPQYTPHKNDCFTLKFSLKFAPISDCDYQFKELIGTEIWNVFEENDYAILNEYYYRFVNGHKLGGYPYFTQADPRQFLPEDKDPYILLLQIDSDARIVNAFEKIHIQWGDVGVCNFFIKRSALEKLDFSEVLYHWDCS